VLQRALTGQFQRKLVLPIEGARSEGKAAAQAKRELSLRSKNKDAWRIRLDEWTYWNGARSIPWAVNATVDVDVDTIGVDGAGRYLITRVDRSLDVHGAATTELTLVAPGILSA